MAAGELPSPGTKYGPCKKACQHRDCAQTRRDAATKCAKCGEPIGFETAFYRLGDNLNELAHARCVEE